MKETIPKPRNTTAQHGERENGDEKPEGIGETSWG